MPEWRGQSPYLCFIATSLLRVANYEPLTRFLKWSSACPANRPGDVDRCRISRISLVFQWTALASAIRPATAGNQTFSLLAQESSRPGNVCPAQQKPQHQGLCKMNKHTEGKGRAVDARSVFWRLKSVCPRLLKVPRCSHSSLRTLRLRLCFRLTVCRVRSDCTSSGSPSRLERRSIHTLSTWLLAPPHCQRNVRPYLINIHQYNLVWGAEIYFVHGVNGVGDAFDHIVPLQSVVTADGRPDSVLQTERSAEICTARARDLTVAGVAS